MDAQELEQKLKADLGRATADKRHPWRYPVLATADGTQPQQRTVVLRKFKPRNWELWFYSDYRSQKISELKANPMVDVHFYHPRKQWQLRLQGQAIIEHRNEIAQTALHNIPENQRQDYQSAQPPGSVLKDGTQEISAKAEENFCIIRIPIKAMDFLELSRAGHFRAKANLNESEGWQWMEVQA